MGQSENVYKDYDVLGFRISILKRKFRFLKKHGHDWPLILIWREKPAGTFKRICGFM